MENQNGQEEILDFNFKKFMFGDTENGAYGPDYGTDRLFGITMDNWVIYLIIFIFIAYIYNKVFRARKLPLLKEAIVYILLALGAFLLLIFETDSSLPIVYSLSVAVGLMLTLRIRYFVMDLQKKRNQSNN
ncbi:YlaH-like family protein [Marinicrinis lubricantis]|uniref:YlaH-like family protein n=1 Tax=Marinicrinis lubricantis TaxID=2086470 RepID=A0ABW1IUP1_9BACL